MVGTVTPKILEGLKTGTQFLYEDLMQAAYDCEFEDYSHGAPCEEAIVDAGKRKKSNALFTSQVSRSLQGYCLGT